MIRGEQRRLAPEDGRHGRVSPEYLIQESSDFYPAPSFGMHEIRIQRAVAFIETAKGKHCRLRAVDGEVEDGKVQEVYERTMGHRKGEGPFSL